MSVFKVANCRSCGSEIVWTVTHKGKRMPVDAKPVWDGNIRLRIEGERVVAEYPGKGHPSLLDDDRPRYVSHFATCDFADEHRRGDL